MDCAGFESLLFDSLDREIALADRAWMRAHENGCARCHRLAALVCGEHEPNTADNAEAFVAAIMANTSGQPCEHAEILLVSDDAVAADSAELVRMHLAACPNCTALARTVARLRPELTALADADPGPGFVTAVMAATPNRDEFIRGRRQGPWTGLRDRLIRRPRLASEIAYVVTASILLMFGWPAASLFELAIATETRLEQSLEASTAAAVAELRKRSDAAQGIARQVGSSLAEPVAASLRSLWNENDADTVEPDTTELDNQ